MRVDQTTGLFGAALPPQRHPSARVTWCGYPAPEGRHPAQDCLTFLRGGLRSPCDCGDCLFVEGRDNAEYPIAQTTASPVGAKPYEKAVYEAVRALLRHGHFARLEIGPGETEGDISVGLHAGWSDGQFVVISHGGGTEWALDTCDASVARELAAALTAYADWCDEDADAFMARLAAEKEARVKARCPTGAQTP